MKKQNPPPNEKKKQLEPFIRQNTGDDRPLTSDTAKKISNDRWSLRAGNRGPTLLQDFHFYHKQSHFNRERIPEKVVHARGDGAYGEFELYKSLADVTTADFLQRAGEVTPVFVRFSNFIGSKGSKDTAIDVRGFATKFYTKEGNYDLLALSFAVFAIMDAMKFADFTHAVKPEPRSDIPQATIAHDHAWDYIANNQEIAHFIMWLMSGRGRPRSWRMMEGWPINTFRFMNKEGKGTFVRFVWKPVLGVHALLLDEANMVGGIDPDYHRRDLREAIHQGAYPQFELGVQLLAEDEQLNYDFDVLDDTKLWPEEEIPVKIIGKMTLNRLPDNHFAEEEQSSFDPATIVPGIDFTNDPVLQGRSFAYRDTDYHRLGTGNINDIPVNRPIVDVNYNERDSYSRYRIDRDAVNYKQNSLAQNTPLEVPGEEGGYVHYPEQVDGRITRDNPGPSFDDHFTQARLFWNSMSLIEKRHIIDTFIFHLGYVQSADVRQQVVDMFANVDEEMAAIIANHIGVNEPSGSSVHNDKKSPVLSLENQVFSPVTQKVGVLIENGFHDEEVTETIRYLKEQGVFIEVVSEKLGEVVGENGHTISVDKPFISTSEVLYDALYIVGGTNDYSKHIKQYMKAAYHHYKPIGVATTGENYFSPNDIGRLPGVVFASEQNAFAQAFVKAIATQRFWNRRY